MSIAKVAQDACFSIRISLPRTRKPRCGTGADTGVTEQTLQLLLWFALLEWVDAERVAQLWPEAARARLSEPATVGGLAFIRHWQFSFRRFPMSYGPELLANKCGNGSPALPYETLHRPGSQWENDSSKASTPACAMNCSTARSSAPGEGA